MGHSSQPELSLHQQLLSPQEAEVKQDLYERLLKMLDVSKLEVIPEPEARQQIARLCNQILSENPRPISLVSRDKIIKQINDEVLGLGPLEPLLADSTISDILINSATSIFVERFGKLESVPMRFHDDRHLMNIIDRIVSSVGRRVDESSPMVDARLQDGSRVNAIIPPLALDGPSMSIRRFTVDKLTAEQLIDYKAMTREMYDVLKAIVQGKLNVLISGGTGSGKTTMLNVLSGYIPQDERIITIEDSAELQLQQPHVVRLESRPANLEGRGEVNQRELVKNSLRMRPDRIVIGEVRGGEALDMLTAMNTGHEGSLTTLHANSSRDALSRLENMVCMAGFDMPVKNIRTQIASAINVVVQLERQEDGKRRVVSISEITGMEGEVITLSDLFVFRRRGRDKEGNILGEFQATGVIPRFYDELVSKGINLSHGLFGSGQSFEII
ncbi:CpaF family protein [Ferrimonas balearica]|uniref:CpaF family protein n=1 Tax=Ferrimonas balearica TaxID=44012 RepID=UPI001C998F51|nr:CpaF family protein [Ferrimonas balearica]MBY5920833.1 CpaF family protein [Ferrimonas balearica]MBY5996482.1 CpaF family protein [Ferrimonas balearica]